MILKDGNAAIEFYKKGFGVEERSRMKSPDGRVAHAEGKYNIDNLYSHITLFRLFCILYLYLVTITQTLYYILIIN